jgi:hypothetical protein
MVALVPLAIARESWIDAYTQVPKVFALRTLTLLLLAALTARSTLAFLASDRKLTVGRGWRASATAHPAGLVLLAAAAVVYANLLATALSPIPQVSVAGADAGRAGGGLATFASYAVAFAAVAGYLRTRAQLLRLLWVIVGAAWLLSIYGIGQHFGIDWFLADAAPAIRVPLTFGNAIFAASVLTMTIPLSLGLSATLNRRAARILGGAALVAPQVAAITFTLTRGSWIGLGTALAIFLTLTAWTTGRHAAVRSTIVLGLGIAATLFLVTIPTSEQTTGTNLVTSRLVSIPESVSVQGGLSSRYAIWGTTIDAWWSSPWPDTNQQLTLPTLTARLIRPLVGYGPDTYAYVYPLAGDTLNGGRAEYAHNFILHSAIEIGILGAIAYLGLIAALGLVLFRLLQRAKLARTADWRTPLLVGLAAALVGRSVEQIAGVAQPTDLLLSWVLAGIVVAVASERFGHSPVASTNQPYPASNRRWYLALIGAAVFLGSLAFVWTEVVLEDAYGARLAARAHEASSVGEVAQADDLLSEAIALSPGAAVSRLGLADRMLDHALTAPTPLAQVEALAVALQQTNAVLDRNPLDARAWGRSVRVKAMLDSLIEGDFADAALQDALTLAALYPGFWEPRVEVAAMRLLTGDAPGALDDMRAARLLGAEGPPVAFAEAMALLADDQIDAAQDAARRLLDDGGEAAMAMHAEFVRNLQLKN